MSGLHRLRTACAPAAGDLSPVSRRARSPPRAASSNARVTLTGGPSQRCRFWRQKRHHCCKVSRSCNDRRRSKLGRIFLAGTWWPPSTNAHTGVLRSKPKTPTRAESPKPSVMASSITEESSMSLVAMGFAVVLTSSHALTPHRTKSSWKFTPSIRAPLLLISATMGRG